MQVSCLATDPKALQWVKQQSGKGRNIPDVETF
jgi:hypothetical protein